MRLLLKPHTWKLMFMSDNERKRGVEYVELRFEECFTYKRFTNNWAVQFTHRNASVLLAKRYCVVNSNTIAIEKWYYNARRQHIEAGKRKL